jgi:hypothetical protein
MHAAYAGRLETVALLHRLGAQVNAVGQVCACCPWQRQRRPPARASASTHGGSTGRKHGVAVCGEARSHGGGEPADPTRRRHRRNDFGKTSARARCVFAMQLCASRMNGASSTRRTEPLLYCLQQRTANQRQLRRCIDWAPTSTGPIRHAGWSAAARRVTHPRCAEREIAHHGRFLHRLLRDRRAAFLDGGRRACDRPGATRAGVSVECIRLLGVRL